MIYEPDAFDVLDFMKHTLPTDASRVVVVGDNCSQIDYVDDDYLSTAKKYEHLSSSTVSPMSDFLSDFEADLNATIQPEVGLLLLPECGSLSVTIFMDSDVFNVQYELYFDVCTK